MRDQFVNILKSDRKLNNERDERDIRRDRWMKAMMEKEGKAGSEAGENRKWHVPLPPSSHNTHVRPTR